MAAIDTNGCYVVQFTSPPDTCTGAPVVVPSSWVTKEESGSMEGRVSVAYPREDPATTRQRVENNETFDENWDEFLAIVKYKSVDINDADRWLEENNNDEQSGNGHLEIVETENYDASNDISTENINNLSESPVQDIEDPSDMPDTPSVKSGFISKWKHSQLINKI